MSTFLNLRIIETTWYKKPLNYVKQSNVKHDLWGCFKNVAKT